MIRIIESAKEKALKDAKKEAEMLQLDLLLRGVVISVEALMTVDVRNRWR